MAAYKIPETAEGRMNDLNEHIEIFKSNYLEFKEKGKKASGLRAKKALTVVKKLGTGVRKDIQEQINSLKKE